MVKSLGVENFRIHLEQEFARRAAANASYSLRSFALSLQLSHSTLSRLLAGSRKITPKMAQKISHRLGLSPAELARMNGASEEARSTPYFVLQQDVFSAMSEWHYDAILELSRLPAPLTPAFVAQALAIPEIQARLALDTLERIELLAKDKAGRLRLVHENSTNILDPDLTSAAQKKYQRSLLQKSIESLEAPRAGRDHTSVTMAIRAKDVPKAKAMLKKFRQEFTALMQEGKKADEVYQLQLAFFPLTKFRRDS